MDQKTQFIADYLWQAQDITGLCAHYGISRKTGYKWIARYLEYGPQGLEYRSRKPSLGPNATDPAIVVALIELRQLHPTWGATKLLAILGKQHADWDLAGRSTVFEILHRQRSRRRAGWPFRTRHIRTVVSRVGFDCLMLKVYLTGDRCRLGRQAAQSLRRNLT